MAGDHGPGPGGQWSHGHGDVETDWSWNRLSQHLPGVGVMPPTQINDEKES